jgi:hypothetical protein
MKFKLTEISCVACLLAVGCDGMVTRVERKPEGESSPQVAEQPAAEPRAEGEPKQQNRGILGKTTAEVVDARKALAENPDLVIVEDGNYGTGYLSQIGNIRVMVASKVSTLGMQQAIQAHRALNDTWPTYDEFMQIMREHRVEFTHLFRWQKYGYDAEEGKIVVFSDEKLKKKIYEDAGLDYESATLK